MRPDDDRNLPVAPPAVERGWKTAAGYFAVCVVQELGHRCGYVAVASSNPAHGVDVTDWDCPIDLTVHGGVTYASGSLYGVEHPAGLWWIGFDCAHAGDGVPGYEELGLSHLMDGPVRSLEYVSEQCELLAAQLRSLEDT